jgi:hypothetical protein
MASQCSAERVFPHPPDAGRTQQDAVDEAYRAVAAYVNRLKTTEDSLRERAARVKSQLDGITPQELLNNMAAVRAVVNKTIDNVLSSMSPSRARPPARAADGDQEQPAAGPGQA